MRTAIHAAILMPCLAAALLAVRPAAAQPFAGAQMPDPKQMSGRPLPVGDLPAGTVTVRVVRGSMTNVVEGQTVELSGGPATLTATTNAQGRAEFPGLTPGTTVMASTTVDGERLESQPFIIPSSGGIRVALVASAGAGAGALGGSSSNPPSSSAPAAAPAQAGPVTLGDQSRFVVEMGEEALNVFNILQVVNPGAGPVQPAQPLVFELPADATGAGALEGSGVPLTVAGNRVTAAGPFPPGATLIQFGYSVPITAGTRLVEQQMPVPLAQLSLLAQKVGALEVHSPQIAEHRDMPVQGQTFIVAKGPAVPAGGRISLEFSGLPHQPLWPRNVALALALAILAAGVWTFLRTPRLSPGDVERRRRIEARRDRLFAELASLEDQHRSRTVDPERYAARRGELVAGLERVYAELDGEAAA